LGGLFFSFDRISTRERRSPPAYHDPGPEIRRLVRSDPLTSGVGWAWNSVVDSTPYIRSEDVEQFRDDLPHLTEEAFLGREAEASEHGKDQKDSYFMHPSGRRFVVKPSNSTMFGEMVGNAAGRRRGPRTRRLWSTMAQQLRIGNQWIRKQCLDLTGKISQSVRKVVEYLLSINRLSYLRSRRRRRCFTYHGKELIY